MPELIMGEACNPLLNGDVPDPSIIRVGDAYYMVSTTMYFCPAAPMMKSYDLINWKIVSYCADIIEDLPSFRMETEDDERIGEYGRGQWASSLRYYHQRFWVLFTNNTTNKSYLFSTADADKGPWERTEFNRRFYDASLFYDEETDRMYIIHGYDTITLTEMEINLSGVKKDGLDKILIQPPGIIGKGAEGAHVYKLNSYYYIFLISWVSGKRVVLCYRSKNIDGPYEGRVVLNRGFGGKQDGVAQGGIVDTQDGDWYGFFFQDRDAVGRVPMLVPMHWGQDFWPVFGNEHGEVPEKFSIKLVVDYESNLYVSDEFDDETLHLAWQWNHNPDNANWSLAARPGFLRLTTGRVSKTIFHARNTLTQRTFEPACEATTALETTGMKNGDKAGLVLLQSIAGFVGIEQEDGQKYIVMFTCDNDSEGKRGQNAAETRISQAPFTGDRVYLRINCQFKTQSNAAETAAFSYSLNGEDWRSIGSMINMRFNWQTHFTGARFGLFNYASKETGGYVDFDYYHVR